LHLCTTNKSERLVEMGSSRVNDAAACDVEKADATSGIPT
jgi:hypothetical protein